MPSIKSKVRITFLFLTLNYASTIAHAQSTYKVLFSTTTLFPGDTLRIELDDVTPNAHYKAGFRGKYYPFYTVGPSAERALIGIPLGSTPGVSPFIIRSLELPKTDPGDSYSLTVASRVYITEDVSFTAAKNNLTKWEGKESAIIHKTAMIASHQQDWEGVFSSPVDGPMIADFGLHRTHNGGTSDAGFHKGIDLRATQGTPVLAANAGIILIAHSFKAHGKTVMIDHGQGVMTIYLHMSSLLVRPGQHVTKGQVIGKVGMTGMATAPHVHWQVFVHSVPVDPHAWMTNEF